jgi:hypothetical protein
MKELSIKEKVKAYDEALEKAKGIIKYYKECNRDEASIEDLKTIFPELQESEDERIRKNCIHFLELQKSHHASTVEIDECISWIDKQGEQKSSAWSEDDEEICHAIENCVCECVHSIGTVRKVRCCNWLKDIKYKNGWKPSDDQMYSLKNALNVVIGERSEYHLTIQELRSLYDDLKKLKED